MSKGTILVTGGTGFVGAHVISQLLEQGYVVRGTARSSSKLEAVFPKADPKQLQIVEVPDLTSDHSAHLKGVDAVVHVAVPFMTTGEEVLKGAYDGTLHIVKQAIAVGVKKIIVTGSYVNMFDTDWKDAFGTRTFNEKSFGSATLETIDVSLPGPQVYQAAKIVAEKKLWEIAHENPDVDITTILPPVVFGPTLHPFTSDAFGSLSTNTFMLKLITTPEDVPVGHMVDVRDVARAHVLALSAPPVAGRDKRFFIMSSLFTWKEVVELVRKERPELASKLPKADKEFGPQTSAPFDTSFAREVLGLDKYIPKEETILAAMDVAAKWEKLHGESAKGS